MTRLIVLRGKKSLSCHYCVACRLQEEQEDKERGERGGVGGGTNPHSETVLDREERRTRMVHRDLNSQLCETLKRGGSHFHEILKRGGSHFHTRIFTRYLRRRGLCIHGLLSQQSSWFRSLDIIK